MSNMLVLTTVICSGNIEKGQIRLETRLEHEVIDKIRVFFDAFQSHEDRLGAISIDIGYLVTRVTRLDELAR